MIIYIYFGGFWPVWYTLLFQYYSMETITFFESESYQKYRFYVYDKNRTLRSSE